MRAGYPTLASFMGAHFEVAIFRRFGALNVQNLLYLQAELVVLERRLRKCEEGNDNSNDPDLKRFSRDWQTLSESVDVPERYREQWRLFQEIRAKLAEYNRALITQSLVGKLQVPDTQELHFLKTWIETPSMGNVYLLGDDSDIWDNPDILDVVTLDSQKHATIFSSKVMYALIRWYHWLIGWRFRKPLPIDSYANTAYYSQRSLLRAGSLIVIALASLLPIATMAVLYSIEHMLWRLFTAGMLNAIFALALGIFTDGRMIEIFSATAAFAAVQVVFIGSTSTSA